MFLQTLLICPSPPQWCQTWAGLTEKPSTHGIVVSSNAPNLLHSFPFSLIKSLLECDIVYFVSQRKCDQYWPDDGCTESYGKLDVTHTSSHDMASYVMRTFAVRHTEIQVRILALNTKKFKCS